MAKTIDHLSDEQVIQMTEEFCKKRLVDIIHMLRMKIPLNLLWNLFAYGLKYLVLITG